jgi:hypothetical protein
MCRDVVNHCEEYKNKIVFLVKNENGKYEYKYNPSKKCFDNVLLHEEGIKKALCKYHRWGEFKYGYCLGTIGENGEQLTYVRHGYEYTPVEE